MKEEGDILPIYGMHDRAKPETFRFARILRLNMTIPERIMWNYLKTKPFGMKFRRQHPINKYVLDFYCHAKRISIEVDGENHSEKVQKEYDQSRTEYLKSVGIVEMRFSNNEILSNFDSIQSTITKVLKE